jgi:rhomboid protease GluP
MFTRQRSGSVVCPSCGRLVGVNDERCFNCGRWNPGLWGYAPLLRRLGNDFGFTALVTGGCIVLFVATLLASGRDLRLVGGGFSFLEPSRTALLLFGGSGYGPVFQLGWWWTLLSASWLHGSAIHILFNVMWIRQLGPATGELYGPSRTMIIFTVSGAVGFLASSIAGAGLTIGASASIFGLLAALVRYGQVTGSNHISSQAWVWAIMLFVFGLLMPGVDNWAHGGGFVGGYLAALAFNPNKREKLEHLVGALACLVATLFAVLASLYNGLGLLRSAM